MQSPEPPIVQPRRLAGAVAPPARPQSAGLQTELETLSYTCARFYLAPTYSEVAALRELLCPIQTLFQKRETNFTTGLAARRWRDVSTCECVSNRRRRNPESMMTHTTGAPRRQPVIDTAHWVFYRRLGDPKPPERSLTRGDNLGATRTYFSLRKVEVRPNLWRIVHPPPP